MAVTLNTVTPAKSNIRVYRGGSINISSHEATTTVASALQSVGYPASAANQVASSLTGTLEYASVGNIVKSIDGPNLSDGEVETTAIADTWRTLSTGGLKSASVDVVFQFDVGGGAQSVRNLLGRLFGKMVYISFKYESGSTAQANPEIFGAFRMHELPLGSVSGGDSDVPEISVTFDSAGKLYEYDGTNVTEYGA